MSGKQNDIPEMLRDAAEHANAAWTSERSIRIHVTPGGLSIEGSILNQDERREYRDARICSFLSMSKMRDNFLIVLVDQVRESLDCHAGTRLQDRGALAS